MEFNLRIVLALLYSVLAAEFAASWILDVRPTKIQAARPLFSFNDEAGTTRPVDSRSGENLPRLGQDGEDQPSDEELQAKLGSWDERVPRFNTLHLTGRVGNSPEPRYYEGNVVVNLSLACQRNYHYAERQDQDMKNGDEETDWYGLEIWGRTAEFVSKYVEKGSRIGVIGTLQIDEWLDKQTGEKQSRAKCIVRELDILESRAEAEARRSGQRGTSFYSSDDDDDLYDPSRGIQGGFFDP